MIDSAKILKGQVWVVYSDLDDSRESERFNRSHVIKKDRPWLVLNERTDLSKYPMYTCVPITRTPGDGYGIFVEFSMGISKSTIAIDQMKSFDQSDFGKYMFTVNDNVIDKVNEVIIDYLGLGIKVPSFVALEQRIDRIIKKKLELLKLCEEENSIKTKSLTDMLYDSIDKMLLGDNNEDMTNNEKLNIASGETKAKRKNYGFWTEETKKEFLSDCKIMGRRELAEKYQLTISSVHSYKYKFSKELN